MTYSLYGQMSKDWDWHCLKTRVPLDKVDDLIAYYKLTWRYVEKREENKKNERHAGKRFGRNSSANIYYQPPDFPA